MKKILLLAIACLFAGFLQAQDTLYRVDGTRQIVRIIEVNPAQVRYVPFSDPDGPIYVLSKQAIARIIYENGTVDSFQAIREPGDTPPVILSMEPFNRNILSFYVFDILCNEFTVSYEHLTKSGKWGFKVPFSRSFSKQESSYIGLVGAGFVRVLEPRKTGRYRGQDIMLGTEQVDLLERFYLQTNLNKAYRRYPIVMYPGYHQRRAGCFGAGNRYMYIDSKGDIHACPFCQGAAGNVLNDSLDDVVKKLRVTGCHEYSLNLSD